MNNAKVSYVTVNDSRLVAGGKLEIGSAVVGLNEFDFGEFGSIQRKVVVGARRSGRRTSCRRRRRGPRPTRGRTAGLRWSER